MNKKNKCTNKKWSFCSVYLGIGATKTPFLQNEYMNTLFWGKTFAVQCPTVFCIFAYPCISEKKSQPQQPQKLYLLAWEIVTHPFNALAWSARPHDGH
jgi:hypothetical protein